MSMHAASVDGPPRHLRRRELRKRKTVRKSGLSAEIAKLTSELAVAEDERDAALKQADEAAAAELRVIEESLEVDARAATISDRVARLEAENEGLRESVKTLSLYRPSSSVDEEPDDNIPDDATSWTEVAEHLPSLTGPGIAFTDRALDSAVNPRYPHPDKMWHALRSLERVGRAYNELGAELGMRFEDFALQRGGLDVALQDSTYEPGCFFPTSKTRSTAAFHT